MRKFLATLFLLPALAFADCPTTLLPLANSVIKIDDREVPGVEWLCGFDNVYTIRNYDEGEIDIAVTTKTNEEIVLTFFYRPRSSFKNDGFYLIFTAYNHIKLNRESLRNDMFKALEVMR